jgi:integrase
MSYDLYVQGFYLAGDLSQRSAERTCLVPVSLSASSTILRPASITAGVSIAEGQRFGLRTLRHSLSNWLVNKAKVQAKTVQSLLRRAHIRTTLGLYTQEDGDETQAAQ